MAILPSSGKVTLTTMNSRIPVDVFESALEQAVGGCKSIFETLRNSARERTAARLAAMQGTGSK